MDWRSVQFDWNRARAFLVTAEEGSLSAAARALGMTQPTLGRQVAALERELGAVLFERAGRGLVLTPSGAALVEHVRAMGAAASRVSATASGQSQLVEGRVCITASDLFSCTVLPPIVAELRRRAPRVTVEVVASNTVQDLLRRESDIAVRHVEPDDDELIGRHIRDFQAYFYASPDYLERLGPLSGPESLEKAVFIGFERDPGRGVERLNASFGVALRPAQFQVVADNGVMMRELARQGLGIAVLPVPLEAAAPDPRLVRVPVALQPVSIPLWLVTHRELHHSARIRLAFDLLVERLSEP